MFCFFVLSPSPAPVLYGRRLNEQNENNIVVERPFFSPGMREGE